MTAVPEPVRELRAAISETLTLPSPGDVYVAAARADHLAHCLACREIAAAADAAMVENGESMARRDRRQLGLRSARHARPVVVT